jgi:hypothetical protein
MRITVTNREAAAFIKLRQLGYPVHLIAKAFGRSTSVVQRRFRFNEFIHAIRKVDLRKLPARIRRLAAARQWTALMKFLPAWENWILGPGGKPP